jgi:hypothetical protein
MLNRIDLNLLVLFEIVPDECHVGRAAEKLNLTHLKSAKLTPQQ